jgi:hypothetical protein
MKNEKSINANATTATPSAPLPPVHHTAVAAENVATDAVGAVAAIGFVSLA